MGAIISSDYPGMDTLQSRLSAARATNLAGLTSARGTLMDNLPLLNTDIAGSSKATATHSVTGVSNAWGSWTEFFSSLTSEACFLLWHCGSLYRDYEIGTGASGSESVYLPLYEMEPGNSGAVFPVKIAAGTRISVRIYGNNHSYVSLMVGYV